jgi:hypothetical protein
VLEAILDAHPELLAEAGERAVAELRVVAEDVAEDVELAVGELRVEDVWERSGKQPDGGYVEPSEAGWEVVGEAVEPFIEELERRIDLERWKDASALCQGILLGLHRVSQRAERFLDDYAPDSLEETASLAVELWSEGLKEAAAKTGGKEGARDAMRRFVSRALPGWSAFLLRAIEGAPRRAGRG